MLRNPTAVIGIFVMALFMASNGFGDQPAEQSDQGSERAPFSFTSEISLPCTEVKNQARTGTCWSFATTSFLEAELMRLGRGEFDLSEMFAVRHTYPLKAQRFIRLHGNTTLGSGSLSGDAMRVWQQFGAVPEDHYDGKFAGQARHNHEEMDAVIQAMLKAVVAKRGETLHPAWPEALEGILDAYLGKVPAEFSYEGQSFTPRSFADWLGIRTEDYISLTSYTHYPFYQYVNLEIPDNWAGNHYWNVPLDFMMSVMNHALENGYSIAWDGDVSERSFKHDKGVAVLPEKPWHERTPTERDELGKYPEPEMTVTQELRQQHFDNHASTDDHLMHVIGTARDQNGTLYYVVKNSWGTQDSDHNGLVHMSEPYVRSKTISIIVHKDALPNPAQQAQRSQNIQDGLIPQPSEAGSPTNTARSP